MKTSKNIVSQEVKDAVSLVSKELASNISLLMMVFYQSMGSLKDFPIGQMSILDLIDSYNSSKEKGLKDLIFVEIQSRILKAKEIEKDLEVVMSINDKQEKTKEDIVFLSGFANTSYETVESAKGLRNGFPKGKFDVDCGMMFKNRKELDPENLDSLQGKELIEDKYVRTVKRTLHESMVSSLFSVSVLAKNGSFMQKEMFRLAVENLVESDMGIFLVQGLIHSKKSTSIHKKMFEVFKSMSVKDNNAWNHWLFVCKNKICGFFSKEEVEYAYNYLKEHASSFMDLFEIFEVSLEVKQEEAEENYYKCIHKAEFQHEFLKLLGHCKRFSTKTQEIVVNGTNSSCKNVFEKIHVLSFLFYSKKAQDFERIFGEFKAMVKTLKDFKDAYFLIDRMEELPKKYIHDLVSSLELNVSIKQT